MRFKLNPYTQRTICHSCYEKERFETPTWVSADDSDVSDEEEPKK
jgi:hypothetical protein